MNTSLPISVATVLAATTVALLAGAPAPASAQQYISTPMDGPMAEAMRGFGDLGARIQGGMDQVTYGAMNDPQVRAGYEQYLAGGGQQDLYRWAQNYVASNGYSPDGVRQVYRQQEGAASDLQRGWAGVVGAERRSADAIGGMQDSFGDNISEEGRATAGGQTYVDPTGAQVGMSYMPNAGPATNPQNGYTYVPNGNGSYTAYDANGFAYQMPYAQ